MSLYVGIDIGTSSAKTIIIDEKGTILCESSREYTVSELRPGYKEIDPEIWMEAVDACLEEMLENVDKKSVKAIGVTGQMHSLIVLGKDGKPIRPVLMWNDNRTSDLVPEVKEKIKTFIQAPYISDIISTGSPAINLLWLKENEPENFKQIYKFLIGPDYIVYRLTGNIQTDFCEASTSSLYDLKSLEWSREMRDFLGLAGDIYPKVKGSSEIAGNILPQWAEKLGLSRDVLVYVGTGDNPAAAISTGCFAGKYPVLSLGTSAVVMFPKEKPDFTARGKNILFSENGSDVQLLVQGVVQSCGSSFSWWMKDVLDTDDFAGETKGIDINHLGESEVIFYPHLNGDKTIYGDPKLKGAFVGLGTDIKRADLSLAVMEGICLAIRQLTEAMHVPMESLKGLRVIGGGSKNDVWMQALADILKVDVVQMESETGAGFGIALLASSRDSENTIMKIIDGLNKTRKHFWPQSVHSALYDKKYEKYLKIHDGLKEIFS